MKIVEKHNKNFNVKKNVRQNFKQVFDHKDIELEVFNYSYVISQFLKLCIFFIVMPDDNHQTITTIESKREHPVIRVHPKMFLNQRRSSDAICLKKDAIVYVPDVSSDLPENAVKQLIQTRVETTQRMKVNDVKFYSKLGIAVIRLMNEDDKKHLVSNVQSMILDTQRHTSVSFTAELDLDSYIVLDRNMSQIPSPNEVARHYAQACETQELRACESISIQFPTIFRIHLTTLDELIKAVNTSGFKIENTSATVYPRADCSFFEDLPQNTNEDKLSSAIAAQIGENHLPPASFYVQYNKQTGAAIVLAAKSAQKWMMEGHLIIDRRNISKKTRLAYRVLVSPVPCGFDLTRILHHKLFAHRVVSHKHIGNNFIIELDNIDTYKDCLKIEDLGVNNNPMTIKPHTVCNDPDNSELDAINWYETAMLDIEPDIATIINNHQHPIFRYKWNAKNWNQQMKKAREMDRHSTKYDLNRHLLRVTVMLNTIAVLRKKKYVIDGEEVTLNLERMRTIGYDHQAKLLDRKIIHQTELKTPYPSTTVKVVNEDCLVLYEKLVSKGYQPLLLNMANARIPGGNYRKGDGGQEENLFRRSDYYQSLDAEVADKDRSERLYCTPKCEVKRSTGYSGFYPMEEFGAIYTSGITVFRQTEANGYAYMKKPLYNVCAIAMAAYREPYLNNKNMLENKPAINTHRKIKNIFAIAHQHKHDCLVLSAFGCGALRNPPEHIALLFKSVIHQYAEYFKKIYFAITDDYNTENQINPDGNFLPFKKILDGLVVEPPKTLRVNGVSGPYRILHKSSHGELTLSDACILYLPPCQHGSQCRDLENPQHTNQYSHPPMCSLQDATSSCGQTNDEVHMFTFIHSMKCKYGNKCNNKNRAHLNKYDHSESYMNASYCESNAERTSSIEPSMEAKHKSLCSGIKNGVSDSSLKDDVPSVSNSSMLSSITMLSSARTPCRDSVYCLQQDLLDHTRKYSHPCRFSELCQNKINEPHLVHERHNIPTCSQDKSCSEKVDPVHRAKCPHTQLPDYLIPCRYQNKCLDESANHRIKYFHGEALPLIESKIF